MDKLGLHLGREVEVLAGVRVVAKGEERQRASRPLARGDERGEARLNRDRKERIEPAKDTEKRREHATSDGERNGDRYEGAAAVRVTGTGQLEVESAGGTLRDEKPVTYQEIGGGRVPVEASWELPADCSAHFSNVIARLCEAIYAY